VLVSRSLGGIGVAIGFGVGVRRPWEAIVVRRGRSSQSWFVGMLLVGLGQRERDCSLVTFGCLLGWLVGLQWGRGAVAGVVVSGRWRPSLQSWPVRVPLRLERFCCCYAPKCRCSPTRTM
jgi:hypothetical protein